MKSIFLKVLDKITNKLVRLVVDNSTSQGSFIKLN